MHFVKKLSTSLLIGLLVYWLIGLFIPSPVFAATTTTTNALGSGWVDNGYAQAFKDCVQHNGVNSFCYTSHVEVGSMINMVRLIAGPIHGVTIDMDESDQNYIRQMYQGSALAGLSSGMAYMITNPPADLALWVRDTGQTLGFIPRQAQAQGVGFTGLTPILSVWRSFRNIAYVLLALVLIVVGFMVMFRKKIDPKTVVTVQNSLPRIVVVLLLITFSYAIVGLLIDLMYLVIAVGIAILGSGFNLKAEVISQLQNTYVNGGLWALITHVFQPLGDLVPWGQLPSDISKQDWQSLFSHVATGIIFFSPLPVVGQLGPITILLLSLAYLFAFVRIFFMLLSAYIHILLAVIFAPLQILMDALPGGNGFVSWLKNLFINLVPFPITVFLLIIGDNLTKTMTAGSLWQPPLLLQMFGGTGNIAIAIIWLGLILTIPSIVGGIKEALKTKPFIPAGAGAVAAPLTEAFQTGTGALSLFYYGANIRQMFFPGKPKQGGGGGH